nr:MAG TPA: hypothetical protein [Caudoviricetes sp.]
MIFCKRLHRLLSPLWNRNSQSIIRFFVESPRPLRLFFWHIKHSFQIIKILA